MREKLRLLDGADLKELYRVTGPELKMRYKILFVKKTHGSSEWVVERTHVLRGYNAVKTNLGAAVRQYMQKGLWPTSISLGVGIFEDGQLIRVLEAKNLGTEPEREQEPFFAATVLKDLVKNKKH